MNLIYKILKPLYEYKLILIINLLIAGFVFRSLLFNLSTNLPDWNDYSLYVWIINQNADHLRNLQFQGFFNTNIFYPFEGSLLFSDLFFPQSIVAVLLQYFTSNPVLIFNIIFFLSIFLNIIASLFFWKNFFTSKLILFFATLITAFSPFIFLNSGHFQIFSIWPIFFALAFLFRNELTKRNGIIVGFWTAVQFMVGVYYAIFLLFAGGIWYLFKYWEGRRDKEKVVDLIKHASFAGITFFLLAGFFIFKYIEVQRAYHISKFYWEYVIYAVHLTDYLFAPYDSLLSSTYYIARWNAFDQHFGNSAGFPGLILLILGLSGFFFYQLRRGERSISFPFSFYRLYFALLMTFGFIFSLGPRLSINGTYIGIPLPYDLVLKLVPVFEPIRAVARWSFFFYLGLAYFALIGLQKFIKKFGKEPVVIVVLSVLYIFEIIPIVKPTESKNYYPAAYQSVSSLCQERPQVILEYPLTQDKKGANIITNLTYKTQMVMATLHHKCKIINGYSGYDPLDYQRYENELYTIVTVRDEKEFWRLMRQRNINIFKLNKNEVYKDKVDFIETVLKRSPKVEILVNDSNFLIGKIIQ